MKKKIITIALMLTLALSFGLTACEDGENTPAGSPSAPKSLGAMNIDGAIRLDWTEPSNKGKSDIIRYEVSKDNGSTWIDAGLSLRYAFTGLTNGTEYIFRVRAVNGQGSGRSKSVRTRYLAI